MFRESAQVLLSLLRCISTKASLAVGESDHLLRKLNGLIEEPLRLPFESTGKPGPLRGDLDGFWSRRIDREQRLVYRVTATSLGIAQCRYHR